MSVDYAEPSTNGHAEASAVQPPKPRRKSVQRDPNAPAKRPSHPVIRSETKARLEVLRVLMAEARVKEDDVFAALIEQQIGRLLNPREVKPESPGGQ